MEIPVTIANGTAFDADLGETAILTISFTTQNEIAYQSNTSLFFYAEIEQSVRKLRKSKKSCQGRGMI